MLFLNAKRKKGFLQLIYVTIVFLFLFVVQGKPLEGAPTSIEQATRVVKNWLAMEAAPMGTATVDRVLRTEMHLKGNEVAYYIVYLAPKGFVVVPADDLVEPIIAFFPNATKYDPSETNPAGALIGGDVPERVRWARHLRADTVKANAHDSNAQNKWRMLEGDTARTHGTGIKSLPRISDIRVEPFIQSTWGQSKVNDAPCYNFYTPKHYPAGCVATAMAQVMRYHRHPGGGVGEQSFQITVDGVSETRNLLGGDGVGGPYLWDSMPLKPDAFISIPQCQAIGVLTHDAGVATNMKYTADGSSTGALEANNAFITVFSYSNSVLAKRLFSWERVSSEEIISMANPNLDALLPVILGIKGIALADKKDGEHAIIVDGYGYNFKTMYHHLNMGWSGGDDAWYNLPVIEPKVQPYKFNSILSCVYNIFPYATGEIISGRVADSGGSPVPDVTVTLSGAADRTTKTNKRGIFAFVGVPSSSSYIVTVSKEGFAFSPSSKSVTTGKSEHNSVNTGNVWQVDFAPAYKYVSQWGAGDSGYFMMPVDVAVNSEGDMYVLDWQKNQVQKFDPSGAFLLKWGNTVWGGAGNDDGHLFAPEGIAVDASGCIYVGADGRVQKFDAEGNYLETWGSPGIGDGQFAGIQGLAIDASGNLYVTERNLENVRVQKFNSKGAFLGKWGSEGLGDGQFDWPKGIAVDNLNNVYVVDVFNHRVQKFDSTGKFLNKWGSQGSGDGQFSSLRGVAVDASGNILVVDSGNRRVQKFDSSGNFLAKWETFGEGDAEFIDPSGITVDASGNVYVTEGGTLGGVNARVLKFDSSGNFLRSTGNRIDDGMFISPNAIAVSASDNTVYIADNERVQKFDRFGNFISKLKGEGYGDIFGYPSGIDVDSSGNVYVADWGFYRVLKYNASGNLVTQWGSEGDGDGQFKRPLDVAVDAFGNVYVTEGRWESGYESDNYRVQKFDSNGNLLAKWGSYGSGDGQFKHPCGILISRRMYL